MTEREQLLQEVAIARTSVRRFRGQPEQQTRAIDTLVAKLRLLHEYEREHHSTEQTVQLV